MRGLYAVTPEMLDSKKLIDMVRKAIAGGATAVQYRSKQVAPDIAKSQAEALRAVTRATGTLFIVNDSSDLALSVDADGVHLGRGDGDAHTISRLRKQNATLFPSRPFMIGVSCYNDLAHAEVAVEAGADYVAFGSFFSSATKPLAVKADISLIRTAKTKFGVPVVAIGGITIDNAPQLIAAGVDAVAVIASLFEAENIERLACEFTNLFNSGIHVRQ